MPDDRFLHRRAGHSDKVSMLTDLEFRVWTQYLLSADDFGVMRASAVTMQADNDHLANRPAKVVQRCIEALIKCGLIREFSHQNRRYVFQYDWQTWQKVSYPRSTNHPKPIDEALALCDDATLALFDQHPGGRKPGTASEGPLSLNERHLRGLVAGGLRALWADVSAVAENVRLGNSYADVIATRTNQRLAVIEVKKTQVYKAALVQVRAYGDVVRSQYPGHSVSLVVIGRGIADSVTAALPADITIVVVDDALLCSVVHRSGDCDIPDKFSLDPKNLTVISTSTTTRAGAPAERLTAKANGYGERLPATAPIHTSHRNHAACGRVCVPAALHGEFVRRRNHDGADTELRDWYLVVSREWSDGGPYAAVEPGDSFDFWKARYAEKWPAPNAVKDTRPAWAKGL